MGCPEITGLEMTFERRKCLGLGKAKAVVTPETGSPAIAERPRDSRVGHFGPK